jgi:uncharacterized damage-inducible protein DinB
MRLIRNSLALTAVVAGVLGAQQPNPLVLELKTSYNTIKSNFLRIAEKMPEEFYGYRPVDGVETFGRRVAHIADANYSVCSALKGENKRLGSAAKTAKADLVAAAKESFAYCDSVVDNLTDVEALRTTPALGGPPLPPGTLRTRLFTLYNMVRHSNEVYGNMSVYLRLKGVVPPTSE